MSEVLLAYEVLCVQSSTECVIGDPVYFFEQKKANEFVEKKKKEKIRGVTYCISRSHVTGPYDGKYYKLVLQGGAISIS